MSRTTRDIDGLVRGNFDTFFTQLDATLAEPWGPLTLVRGEIETIEVPNRIVKPRRFDIIVQLNGVTWRRVQIEISPDEGQAGSHPETFSAPSLAGFGLPTPSSLVSMSLAYQIAQKIHACTDPHDPPASINDRARDVIDLLLLSNLCDSVGHPNMVEIRTAVEDIFRTRAKEATTAGALPRAWPASVTAHTHWKTSFIRAAESAGMSVSLSDAVNELNNWLTRISTHPLDSA